MERTGAPTTERIQERGYWVETRESLDNPRLVLAHLLQEQGHDIRIWRAGIKPRIAGYEGYDDMLRVVAPNQTLGILRRVSEKQEFQALVNAFNAPSKEPDLTRCDSLSQEEKDQVLGTYWLNRAQRYEKEAMKNLPSTMDWHYGEYRDNILSEANEMIEKGKDMLQEQPYLDGENLKPLIQKLLA